MKTYQQARFARAIVVGLMFATGSIFCGRLIFGAIAGFIADYFFRSMRIEILDMKIMNTNEKHIWFPAKKYDWGWGPPCAWQGWVVFAVWLVLLGGGGIFLAPRSIALFGAYAFVLGVALFIVALIKGEKPRWRWGKD